MLPDLLLGDAQRATAFRSMLTYLKLSLDEKPSDAPPPLSDVFLVVQDDKISFLSLFYLNFVFFLFHFLSKNT